jgi:hypothetical protein
VENERRLDPVFWAAHGFRPSGTRAHFFECTMNRPTPTAVIRRETRRPGAPWVVEEIKRVANPCRRRRGGVS